MDTIVIYIVCDKCGCLQEFHGQFACDACKQRFSPFSIARQLLEEQKEKKT